MVVVVVFITRFIVVIVSSPGEIIDSNLTIACSEKSIKIIEIQKEGKTRQTAEKFLLGSKLKQGEIIS